MNQVAQHAHCEICGRVVSVGKRVCSPECQTKLDEAVAFKKRQMWKFVGIIVAALVLFQLIRLGVI